MESSSQLLLSHQKVPSYNDPGFPDSILRIKILIRYIVGLIFFQSMHLCNNAGHPSCCKVEESLKVPHMDWFCLSIWLTMCLLCEKLGS